MSHIIILGFDRPIEISYWLNLAASIVLCSVCDSTSHRCSSWQGFKTGFQTIAMITYFMLMPGDATCFLMDYFE